MHSVDKTSISKQINFFDNTRCIFRLFTEVIFRLKYYAVQKYKTTLYYMSFEFSSEISHVAKVIILCTNAIKF